MIPLQREQAVSAPHQNRCHLNKTISRTARAGLAFTLAAHAFCVGAQQAEPAAPASTVQASTLPARIGVGYEEIKLPGNERMGLVGTHYIVELSPGWWLGPSVYGAATGDRGGFFTFGIEGQRSFRLGDQWGLAAGLYVGGGGGASAPVGGGLMLRPHIDLLRSLGDWAIGVSASQVHFPNGSIKDTQFGLILAFRGGFTYTEPGYGGERVLFGQGRGGLGIDRMSVAVGRYREGSNSGGDLTHVGMRLERHFDDVWAGTLEAAGAAAGSSDGYAEALGGISALWPLGTPRLRVGVHGALGLAGGGAVPTGGGGIAKLALTSRVQIAPRVFVDLEAGRVKAIDGELDANYGQLAIGLQLADAPAGWSSQTVHESQWSLAFQNYREAQRKDGTTRSMSTIGLKFQREIDRHFYWTGQAHTAMVGGAGAYSAGLVGAGAMLQPDQDKAFNAGLELMVGAAGGGGVAVTGGGIYQGQVWGEYRMTKHQRLSIGVGQLKAMKGDLSTPVIEAAWSLAFGVP
jgi:hypothetical protein